MKTWLNYGVETGIGWPMVRTSVPYAGRVFILHPPADGDSATVSVAYEDGTYVHPGVNRDDRGEPRCANYDEASQLMERFLSALAWYSDNGITTHAWGGGGHLQAAPPNTAHVTFYPGEKFEHLVEPTTNEARLALALYREGLSVNSVPYQFLAFVKVLNIKFRKEGQTKWMNDHAGKVTGHEAERRVAELRTSGTNIGEYLYREGRNAVAHAIGKWRVMDPDDPVRTQQLREDVPLMRALARHFIEVELGVNTPAKEADERDAAFWARRGQKPPRPDAADERVT